MSDAPGSTPWRRTTDEIAAGLRRWAAAWRGDAAAEIADVRAPDSGMANDTVLFALDGEAMVARLAPAPGTPYPTFPTFDLDLQRRAMELVAARTDVPVPEVVHHETSDAWLGSPFLVTRAVVGEVPSDNPPYLLDPEGWVLQATPEERARLEESTIRVLARLHEITGDREETAFLELATAGDTALQRQLSALHDFYDWAREGKRIPLLERALDTLVATMPTTRRSVLNWGDSRPGNIIYRDFEPVAVLDWEMAGVGPPELDVAWATFFQRFWASMVEQFGLSVEPMFERQSTAATYERLSGAPLDDLAWYELFAGVRFGVILVRMSHRSIAFGQMEPPDDPDEHVMFVPLLERLIAEVKESTS